MINRLTTLLTCSLFQIHNVAIFAYLAGIMQEPAPRNAIVFPRKKSRYADSSSQGAAIAQT